jgi:DNA polymerase delta subunit 3
MLRFCGVFNSFVKRTSNGKHVSSLPPKPVNSAAAATQSKPSVTPKEQSVTARKQDLPGVTSLKQGAGNKSEKDNSTVVDKAANAPVAKEPSIAAHANKIKAQNGKAMPGNGGSLANMWGRASVKPKPPATTNPAAVANVAGIVLQIFMFLYFLVYNSQHSSIVYFLWLTTVYHMLLIFSATADAQICAKEEADADSSDDEHGVKYKRGSSNANNRKRRAVFDYSDDEEDGNIISIASPELPKQEAPDHVTETAEDTEANQKNLDNKEDIESNAKGCSTVLNSELSSECKTKSVNTANHSGITVKEKSSDPPINGNKQDSTAAPASTSPKRRKVLKTRIDERGREGSYLLYTETRHTQSPPFFLAHWQAQRKLQCHTS